MGVAGLPGTHRNGKESSSCSMTCKAKEGTRLSWWGTCHSGQGMLGRTSRRSYRLLCIKHQVFVELDEVGESHLIPGFHLLWEMVLRESGATQLEPVTPGPAQARPWGSKIISVHSWGARGVLTTSLSRRNLMLGTR